MVSEVSSVDAFFKSVGLSKPLPPQKFWERLEKSFGPPANSLGLCIANRERGVKDDPYKIKNSSLEFANAVLSQFDQEKLKAVAVWMLRERLIQPGSSVLEIGCDNGLLLCFLAKMYPQANFVGADTCEEAIAIAKQRATDLRLKNVAFLHSDIASLCEKQHSNSFDVAFSVAVFHELLADGLIGESENSPFSSKITAHSISDFDSINDSTTLSSEDVACIHGLLKADGRFISVDRWPRPWSTLAWARTAEASGFQLDLPSSFMISYLDPAGGKQSLPLTCFVKGTTPARAIDVVALHAYPDFDRNQAIGEIKSPLVAELIHSGLCRKPLIMMRAIYSSGEEKIELGLAGGLGYLYRSSTLGFRELFVFPSIVTVEKGAYITAMWRDRREHSEVSVECYPENADLVLGVTPEWLTGLTSLALSESG